MTSVDISPDGKRVVSAMEDGVVKIWGTETGAEVHSDPGSCGGPYAIAYCREPVPGLRTRTRSREDLGHRDRSRGEQHCGRALWAVRYWGCVAVFRAFFVLEVV